MYSLRERRKHYLEQGTDGNGKPEFLAPYEYRAGRRYDLDLDSPPSLPDRYSVGSEILQWCKDRLPCWLWDKLNTVLNKTFCHDELTSEREQAMVSAVQFFEAHLEYAEGAVARLRAGPAGMACRFSWGVWCSSPSTSIALLSPVLPACCLGDCGGGE